QARRATERQVGQLVRARDEPGFAGEFLRIIRSARLGDDLRIDAYPSDDDPQVLFAAGEVLITQSSLDRARDQGLLRATEQRPVGEADASALGAGGRVGRRKAPLSARDLAEVAGQWAARG